MIQGVSDEINSIPANLHTTLRAWEFLEYSHLPGALVNPLGHKLTSMKDVGEQNGSGP